MITVQLDQNQHKTLDGRIAKIVRWLIEREQEVEGPPKVTLTFDCAGESVTPEVKVRHQTLKS